MGDGQERPCGLDNGIRLGVPDNQAEDGAKCLVNEQMDTIWPMSPKPAIICHIATNRSSFWGFYAIPTCHFPRLSQPVVSLPGVQGFAERWGSEENVRKLGRIMALIR